MAAASFPGVAALAHAPFAAPFERSNPYDSRCKESISLRRARRPWSARSSNANAPAHTRTTRRPTLSVAAGLSAGGSSASKAACATSPVALHEATMLTAQKTGFETIGGGVIPLESRYGPACGYIVALTRNPRQTASAAKMASASGSTKRAAMHTALTANAASSCCPRWRYEP